MDEPVKFERRLAMSCRHPYHRMRKIAKHDIEQVSP
jgi:hypothetical protein